MLLMGLKPEYRRALEFVKKLRITQPSETPSPPEIPFFETTIRYLGGFLAAYTLTSDKLFLARADELGKLLLPAFDTKSGLPSFNVDVIKGQPKPGPKARKNGFSESTSFAVEFVALSTFTGKKIYREHVDRLADILASSQLDNSLWPTFWDSNSGRSLTNGIAVGGNADSGYEYLLKTWLSDPNSKEFRDMYMSAADAIISNLLYISPNRHLLYATDIPNYKTGVPTNKFEHLTCFLPGLLSLGVHTLHEHLSLRQRRTHMWAAEGLAQTCWAISMDSQTGLGPDEVVFARWPTTRPKGKDGKPIPVTPEQQNEEERRAGRWVDALAEWERTSNSRWRKGGVWGTHEEANTVPPGVRSVVPIVLGAERGEGKDKDKEGKGMGKRDYWLRRPENALRPEVVESLYILWRTTNDAKWREKGWQVCEAIIDEGGHSRTPSGAYSTVRNVDSVPVRWTDSTPSWFFAETLKYCFLLTSSADLLPLDRYVFNTQGHPVPRWGWEGWHKKKEWRVG
ncbi:hypothetical protein FRB90_007618 [Tulasnella sp. 427]|nr:hypothetical protein FRB90_007618 [Tulasnella sp. 427]